ncbi:MAG: hypothetical protein PHT51_05260 [Patescibacteria group bacterium]|nr:hypothetical protein [Patescibacteria group bacterium]MDD4611351.1 hypothetical protein [Patescibacteria group bacterium]
MKKIIIATLLFSLVLTGCSLKGKTAAQILKPEEAKAKAEKFITDNLVQAGTKVTVKEITEENDLYKLKVDIGSGQDIESYITKDGQNFFPQVINIAELEKQVADQNAQVAGQKETATVTTKSDKPIVELFVMSYCPYGTQIEKGIIPAVEALGDKIDFKLKFCDYTMHGAKEAEENLRQYCIGKEQSGKLFSYMNCFLKAGDSDSCLNEAGVDTGKMDSCVAAATKEYAIDVNSTDFAIYKDDAQKYGVQGSPTLVINGGQVSSSRDSANLLKTICSAFNNTPEECSKTLSSETPAAGFGTGVVAGDSTSAGCAQ